MYNLQQTVVQSTHRQGHVLDWVIVRPDEGIHQATQVSDDFESDHRCVLVQFDVSVSRPPPVHPLFATFVASTVSLSKETWKRNCAVS